MNTHVSSLVKRVLLGISALALISPLAASAVSYMLPDTTVDSSNLYLEVARAGDGNSLQSPQTFVKFAFNSVTSRVINIYDGAFCTSSNYDTNDPPTPPSCTSVGTLWDPVRRTNVSAAQQLVDYTFYAYDNDTGKYFSAAPPAGRTNNTYSITKNSTQLAANGTTSIDVSSLSTISYDTDHKYFVIMLATFRDPTQGLGGVDAFKVSLKNQNGLATYDSTDLTAPDNPLAIQHRWIDPRTTDTDTFQFAMGCDITSDTVASLKWQDADAGTATQPEDITWTLHDDTSNTTMYTLHSTGTVRDYAGRAVSMGGSGATETFKVRFIPRHRYTWKWSNVNSYNGVQVFLPFDSYNYIDHCTDVTVDSVDESNTALPFSSNGSLSYNGVRPSASAKFNTRNAVDRPVTNPITYATDPTGDLTNVENGFPWRITETVKTAGDPLAANWGIIGYVACDATDNTCSVTDQTRMVTTNPNYWNFTPINGKNYRVRFYWRKLLDSACSVSVNPNPSVSKNPLAQGDIDSFNITFKNTGSSSWASPPITMKETDSNGGAAQNINIPPASNPVLYGQEVTFPFNATPIAPGVFSYSGQMQTGNSTFGAVCSGTVTVIPTYDYQPTLVVSPTTVQLNSSTPSGTITTSDTIRNNCPLGVPSTAVTSGTCFAPGSRYKTWTNYTEYSPAGTVVATGTVVTAPPSTNSYAGLSPATSAAPVTGTVSVPAGTPDSTLYCFQSFVNPGTNLSPSAPNPETATNSTPNYSFASPVNCVEVVVTRNVGINVTQGNVHAGGGIGGTCTPTTQGLLSTTPGSYGEFLGSSAAQISNFGTGGVASGNGLTLSNGGGVGPYGNYGVVCRPDLAKAAGTYLTTRVLPNGAYTIAAGALSNTGNFPTQTVIQHSGALTIAANVLAPGQKVTIYNTGGDVTITGDITYPIGNVTIPTLASFGIITNSTSNVYFDASVKNFAGFISAGGFIDTCLQHSSGLDPTSNPLSHSVNDCTNTLTITGSFVANKLYLFRSGTPGGTAYSNGEIVNQSALLYLAPPPAFENVTNSVNSLPQYQGERVPLY